MRRNLPPLQGGSQTNFGFPGFHPGFHPWLRPIAPPGHGSKSRPPEQGRSRRRVTRIPVPSLYRVCHAESRYQPSKARFAAPEAGGAAESRTLGTIFRLQPGLASQCSQIRAESGHNLRGMPPSGQIGPMFLEAPVKCTPAEAKVFRGEQSVPIVSCECAFDQKEFS